MRAPFAEYFNCYWYFFFLFSVGVGVGVEFVKRKRMGWEMGMDRVKGNCSGG